MTRSASDMPHVHLGSSHFCIIRALNTYGLPPNASPSHPHMDTNSSMVSFVAPRTVSVRALLRFVLVLVLALEHACLITSPCPAQSSLPYPNLPRTLYLPPTPPKILGASLLFSSDPSTCIASLTLNPSIHPTTLITPHSRGHAAK